MLQDIHILDEQQMSHRASITGFTLISAMYHRNYGYVTYIKNYINNWNHLYLHTVNDTIFVIAIIVAGVT